jgi:hypothetical protein
MEALKEVPQGLEDELDRPHNVMIPPHPIDASVLMTLSPIDFQKRPVS